MSKQCAEEQTGEQLHFWSSVEALRTSAANSEAGGSVDGAALAVDDWSTRLVTAKRVADTFLLRPTDHSGSQSNSASLSRFIPSQVIAEVRSLIDAMEVDSSLLLSALFSSQRLTLAQLQQQAFVRLLAPGNPRGKLWKAHVDAFPYLFSHQQYWSKSRNPSPSASRAPSVSRQAVESVSVTVASVTAPHIPETSVVAAPSMTAVVAPVVAAPVAKSESAPSPSGPIDFGVAKVSALSRSNRVLRVDASRGWAGLLRSKDGVLVEASDLSAPELSFVLASSGASGDSLSSAKLSRKEPARITLLYFDKSLATPEARAAKKPQEVKLLLLLKGSTAAITTERERLHQALRSAGLLTQAASLDNK
jgi:hypothetical protein